LILAKGEWVGDALKLGMTFGIHVEKGGVIRSEDPNLNIPARFTMVRGIEGKFFGNVPET
jgi:hypothetical protein